MIIFDYPKICLWHHSYHDLETISECFTQKDQTWLKFFWEWMPPDLP